MGVGWIMGTGAGVATGFALVVVFAIVVVVVGAIGLVFKIGFALIKAIFGPCDTASPTARYSVCRQNNCGHENRTGARYCAQCGKPL